MAAPLTPLHGILVENHCSTLFDTKKRQTLSPNEAGWHLFLILSAGKFTTVCTITCEKFGTYMIKMPLFKIPWISPKKFHLLFSMSVSLSQINMLIYSVQKIVALCVQYRSVLGRHTGMPFFNQLKLYYKVRALIFKFFFLNFYLREIKPTS